MNKSCLFLLILLLSSCANMPYGNFSHVSQDKDSYLANDAINQISHLYPPTRNTFAISQNASDPFGSILLQELRKKGYGVVENIRPRDKANFFYLFDEIKPKHLYRISLYIGSQTLSRVYVSSGNKLSPIGPWSYKES